MKSKLLLHVCCAPCSTHVIKTLNGDYDITAYFYNPNIQPKKEYEKRLKVARNYSRIAGLNFFHGKYDTKKWFSAIKGYEGEKEGGERCKICYRLRINDTAKKAKEKGFEYFTTTLTISPHKDAGVINAIGSEISEKYGIKFYSADFKKKDGFKKSVEISKKHDLYRQNYCGCIYSLNKNAKKLGTGKSLFPSH